MTRTNAWKIVRTFVADSAIPGILALAYAWWSHYDKSPLSWPLLVKDFGIAYFLLMWFVSQFSRVSKRIDDQTQLQELRTDVAAVRRAIEKKGVSTDPQPLSQTVTIADPVARGLVMDSRAALDAGLMKSGLLTLAVAFEHSLRNFAIQQGIARATALPVSQIIDLLAPMLGENVADDMRGLWLTRHALTHLEEKETIPEDQALRIANAFLWAMQLLSMQVAA